VPEGEIAVAEQLPNAPFLDVLVLVQASLPPLPVTPGEVILDALVRAGLHQSAHAAPGVRSGGIDVDDVLHHDVVEEPAVDGTVAALDEVLLEAALVEALDALLAAVARSEKLDVGVRVVREHVDDFVVEAFVEVVAILEMRLADFGFVCWSSC